MLDAQLHYPVFRYEVRDRKSPALKRGARRVFRIGESRPVSRETGRR
jgi:hypothetical protein